MTAQEMIARGYTVTVRPPADAADGYHVVYTPRASQQGRSGGLFPAIGNGGGAVQAPTPLEAVAQVTDSEVAVRWASAHGPEAMRDEFDRDVQSRVRLFSAWLERLLDLVRTVDAWAKELGWATRIVEKPMEDSQIGRFKVPGLLMQEGVDRILLEPIGRSAPGAEGVVDLYLMPAYDDIATLYYYEGRWNLHSASSKTGAVETVREAPSKPLSKDTFREVLDEMRQHAA
jgi:hypothetical protein